MKGLFREGECFGSPLATIAFNFNSGERELAHANWEFVSSFYSFILFALS